MHPKTPFVPSLDFLCNFFFLLLNTVLKTQFMSLKIKFFKNFFKIRQVLNRILPLYYIKRVLIAQILSLGKKFFRQTMVIILLMPISFTYLHSYYTSHHCKLQPYIKNINNIFQMLDRL